MNNFLCDCIQKKEEIELRYNGFSRTVHPYACGSKKSGEILLRCYQVDGGSLSGTRTGWKLLKVDEISSMDVTGNNFQIRPEYTRGDKGIFNICCQV